MSWRRLILLILSGLFFADSGWAQDLPLGETVNRSGSTITGATFRVWAPNATSVVVRGATLAGGKTRP